MAQYIYIYIYIATVPGPNQCIMHDYEFNNMTRWQCTALACTALNLSSRLHLHSTKLLTQGGSVCKLMQSWTKQLFPSEPNHCRAVVRINYELSAVAISRLNFYSHAQRIAASFNTSPAFCTNSIPAVFSVTDYFFMKLDGILRVRIMKCNSIIGYLPSARMYPLIFTCRTMYGYSCTRWMLIFYN